MNKRKKDFKGKIVNPVFYGKRLTLVRVLNGWSMDDLSKMTGITKQTISRYESGRVEPNIATLLGICKILGVKEDFFTAKSVNVTVQENRIAYKLLPCCHLKNAWWDSELAEWICKDCGKAM